MKQLLRETLAAAVTTCAALIVVAFSAATPALADTNASTFGGLKWGMRAAAIKAALTSHGYAFIKKDADGDLDFTGDMLHRQTGIFALLSRGELAKVLLVVSPPENGAQDLYNELKEALVKKYGSPTKSFAFYDDPYFAGDGYEEQAISVGKGHIADFWTHVHGDQENVETEIGRSLMILVSYEGPLWSSEADRRKASATDSL